ncbi:Uncharacterized protein DAT39_022859 [Clarias magur]|uniref:Uncharacterized protein n=1 Tax=Clarias magur TaxID=1594786 RepID=A0A8J4TCZ2_CLAMG|nr:Uncharacterized protein DAT39_022859 [Clarias magur]
MISDDEESSEEIILKQKCLDISRSFPNSFCGSPNHPRPMRSGRRVTCQVGALCRGEGDYLRRSRVVPQQGSARARSSLPRKQRIECRARNALVTANSVKLATC